ncbi:hypothetical protein PM082_010609 [Marasmius tenuissimus]|nr:hypothetical protein PM082_010609 [Marasmius tenuissimus]
MAGSIPMSSSASTPHQPSNSLQAYRQPSGSDPRGKAHTIHEERHSRFRCNRCDMGERDPNASPVVQRLHVLRLASIITMLFHHEQSTPFRWSNLPVQPCVDDDESRALRP